MSAKLGQIREDIVSKTEDASEDARKVVNALNDALICARSFRSRAGSITTAAAPLGTFDTLPLEFTGIIRGYRFGFIDPIEGEGREMPKHQFEVECVGGLWLHVAVGSDKFDKFLMTTGIETFAGGKTLNGETVTVRRDPKYGQLIPIGLGVTSADKEPIGYDKFDRPVCVGDRVRLKGPKKQPIGRLGSSSDVSRSFVAVVAGLDGSGWKFQRPNRKSLLNLTFEEIIKYQTFEKIS